MSDGRAYSRTGHVATVSSGGKGFVSDLKPGPILPPFVPYRVSRVGRKIFSWGWLIFAYVFLLSPIVIVVGASFDGAASYSFVSFPPKDPTIAGFFEIPLRYFRAIGVSVLLATLTAFLSVLLGVPAALALVRSALGGKQFMLTLLRSPLQIPSVVVGISFLQMYYAVGNATGLYITGTFFGLLLGHLFHAMPYVVGTTMAVLYRYNLALEEAALSLGASHWSTFRRVTLPIVLPGVYAGALYSFLVSFGDVPISIFLTSPRLMTFPVEVFMTLGQGFEPSLLTSSTLVIGFSLLAMLLVQRFVGLNQILHSAGVNR